MHDDDQSGRATGVFYVCTPCIYRSGGGGGLEEEEQAAPTVCVYAYINIGDELCFRFSLLDSPPHHSRPFYHE